MVKLVLGPLIQNRLWCVVWVSIESRNSCAVCLWLGWTFNLCASYDYMCCSSVLRPPLVGSADPRARILIVVDLLLRRKRGTTKQILQCVLVTFGSIDGHSGLTFSPPLQRIALTSINYGPFTLRRTFQEGFMENLTEVVHWAFVVDSEVLEAMPTLRLSA